MKILFLGDVMGRDGRNAVAERLPELRRIHALDAIIVNAENAAHGFGVTPQICDDLFAAGADCITTGDHAWDKREIIPYIEKEKRLLRALNSPELTPGNGTYTIETPAGKILVAHLMCRTFMKNPLDDPFAAIDALLGKMRLGRDAQAIIIDVHGEATSEKQALGVFCDGRASLVVGTHTHVPTADARVLPRGTGFQTDAGMCGCYDSVIGMSAKAAIERFTHKVGGERLHPVDGPVTLCGVIADIDPATGLCRAVHPFREGGFLTPTSTGEAA